MFSNGSSKGSMQKKKKPTTTTTTHTKGEIIKLKEINEGSGAQVHITCYNYMACSESGKYLAVISLPINTLPTELSQNHNIVTYNNLTFNYAIQ